MVMDSRPGPKPKKRGRAAQAAGSLRVPAYLAGIPAAAKAWRTLVPLVDELYGFSRMDEPALASLCLAFATQVAAAEVIARDGVLVRDERTGVTKRSPAVLAWRDASAQFRSWCSEFGLSPAARSAMPAEKMAGENDLAALVKDLMASDDE